MSAKFAELINSEKPVLIDFFATWCGPCQYQMPILDEVSKNVGDAARILKVDVDKNQELASQLGIRGVPTLMIFKDGQMLWRASGVKQTDELVGLLRQYA
jgi:thioredoxin 1